MTHRPTPKQALLLWKLITAETDEDRKPLQSKTRPDLKPEERKPLIAHGFLTLEPRPGKKQGQCLVLTDKAWTWAAEALDVEIMKSNSPVGAEVLQALLRQLLRFLERQEIPLASLFSQPRATAELSVASSPARAPSAGTAGAPAPLPDTIEEACLSLTGGARKTRVRLSALRTKLSSIERSVLDKALLKLQDEGRLVLYRDDNTAALTDDDHRAALSVGGAPRHLVLLEA